MKKLFTVFMMFLYMASAIGVTFSLHYCGGSYKQICFTADTEEGCCGANEHKSNCCDDKVISAKFKDDYTTCSKVILAKVIFSDAVLFDFPHRSVSNCYKGYSAYIANDSSPPVISDVPIYLMNRVLRV